jgi:hypothetical protein
VAGGQSTVIVVPYYHRKYRIPSSSSLPIPGAYVPITCGTSWSQFLALRQRGFCIDQSEQRSLLRTSNLSEFYIVCFSVHSSGAVNWSSSATLAFLFMQVR